MGNINYREVGQARFIDKSQYYKLPEIQNCYTRNEAFLYFNPRKKELVVTFRGSYTENWLRQNFDSALVDYMEGSDIGKVHKGFKRAVKNLDHPNNDRVPLKLTESVLDYFNNGYTYETQKKKTKNVKPEFITISGHSLGGAMATLFALNLISQKKIPRENIQLITFGSPRVGNLKFAILGNYQIKHFYRIVYNKDPFVYLPTQAVSYRHCGILMYFKDTANYEIKGKHDNLGFKGINFKDHLKYDDIGFGKPNNNNIK